MTRTNRRPRRGSKVVDRSCRNHGSCKWCRDNRTHKARTSVLCVEHPGRYRAMRWLLTGKADA